ncbi:MAG: SprT family zinc-dependent metalloprotease [Mariprofundus sp.]
MNAISYNIVRRPKRKTTSIVIHPDNRIDVLAPTHISESDIAQWISSKQAWIEKKIHFNSNTRRQHQVKLFRQHEPFTLLGREYTLAIELSGKHHTALNGSQLLCQTATPDQRETLRKQITHWYRQYALNHLQQRVDFYATLTAPSPALVGIKNYRSRWGTCHHDGRIYFNWRIIMAPPHVVDYVVVHELCHLRQHNHSPAYWQLVASVIPDHLLAREWLKVNGLSLDL